MQGYAYGHYLSTRHPFHECMSTTVCYTWSGILGETRVPQAWALLPSRHSGLFISEIHKVAS